MNTYTISETEEGRIDKILATRLPDISRSNIVRLFDEKKILVNDKYVKPSYQVRAFDSVVVDYDANPVILNNLIIPIIYEDHDTIVINKPEGILSHSKGVFNNEETVETFISSKLLDSDYNRAGIVHRLDRATSGVMICAKTLASFKWLQKQFSTRKVKKIYFAIVSGHFDDKSALIDLPILRDHNNPSRFKVDIRGKVAKTKYTVISENDKYSLIKLEPETGRTHQLRVHLKYLKHPIVGDTFYGGDNAKRLYLHASELDIKLLSGENKKFIIPVPESFDDFMNYN
jgi:23S rRNA pseudouridine1911/1915/1917 synthase